MKIAIGEKLQPYAKGLVDWVTAHMPDIESAVGQAVDFVTGKIDGIIASVKELTASPEWKNAGSLWEKIKLAWDKIIVEPFSEWWNGTGKAWLAGIAESVGAGLGTALHDGIMGLLGIDVGGVAADGVSIGKSFASAFAEGFNGKEVGEAIVQAIKEGLKSLAKDAMTLLPGEGSVWHKRSVGGCPRLRWIKSRKGRVQAVPGRQSHLQRRESRG